MDRPELHPAVRIGHVHLRVADLERATAFYRDVLGFNVTVLRERYAFLSAGGYHHHVGLNTWHSEGAYRRLRGTRGCTTSPSCTPTAASSPGPSAASLSTATRSTGRRTTG
jgi:catechol 2,3-dioxygenase